MDRDRRGAGDERSSGGRGKSRARVVVSAPRPDLNESPEAAARCDARRCGRRIERGGRGRSPADPPTGPHRARSIAAGDRARARPGSKISGRDPIRPLVQTDDRERRRTHLLGSLRASDAPRALTESREGARRPCRRPCLFFAVWRTCECATRRFAPRPNGLRVKAGREARPARESLSSQSLSLRVGRPRLVPC